MNYLVEPETVSRVATRNDNHKLQQVADTVRFCAEQMWLVCGVLGDLPDTGRTEYESKLLDAYEDADGAYRKLGRLEFRLTALGFPPREVET